MGVILSSARRALVMVWEGLHVDVPPPPLLLVLALRVAVNPRPKGDRDGEQTTADALADHR
jgi:hypothetical protein